MAKRINGHGRSGHNSGTLWLSRSYNNIDRDPECDVFRGLWQKEKITESDLAVVAGLSKATVSKMFDGTTRRPLHATFAKMAGAMKSKYALVREATPNYVREIPKAREQYRDYRAAQKRKQRRREAAAKKK